MNIDQIKTGTKVHMIGIGGVSMAPLAEVLQSKGILVTGSDGMESPTTARLRSLGIPVAIGHRPENINAPHCIIRTAAVHEDNPEIIVARKNNIPVFERAQGWGNIMKSYENALCIAGTHGKTTTTAMSAQIFLDAQRDPTLMLGGVLPSIGSGHCMGSGDTIILESCEYCNSFHHFFPTVAVITNIEEDHLDFFKDLEEIKQSFTTFAQKIPPTGMIFLSAEDQNCLDVQKNLPQSPSLTYGIHSGDIYAKDLTWTKGFPSFTFVYQETELCKISLQVPGNHNVLNALAASAAAHFLGIPPEKIAQGLANFTGAGRRFQHKGTFNGATVMDDYAHHPTELKALFDAVDKLDYNRVICCFQPHTFTRTKAFFQEFADVLSRPDKTILMDIYAAREPDLGEVSSQRLSDKIEGSIYTGTHENTLKVLEKIAQPDDLILTVGAGDVFLVGENLVKKSP